MISSVLIMEKKIMLIVNNYYGNSEISRKFKSSMVQWGQCWNGQRAVEVPDGVLARLTTIPRH